MMGEVRAIKTRNNTENTDRIAERHIFYSNTNRCYVKFYI